MDLWWWTATLLVTCLAPLYAMLFWLWWTANFEKVDVEEKPVSCDRHEEVVVPPVDITQLPRKTAHMHFNSNVVDLDEWRKRA